MLGRQRPGKLNSRRVVHKSTGGMLNPIPEPVDPVGNAPSSSLNTVALPGQRLSILGAISHTVESSYQSRDGKMIQPIATRWRR